MKISRWFAMGIAVLFVLGSAMQSHAQPFVEFEGRLYYSAGNVSTSHIKVQDSDGIGGIDTIILGPALVLNPTPVDGLTFDQNGTDLLVGKHDQILRVPTTGGPSFNLSAPGANAVADHMLLDDNVLGAVTRVWSARSVAPGDPSLDNTLEETDLGTGAVTSHSIVGPTEEPVDVSGLTIVDLDGGGLSPPELWISDNAGRVYSVNIGTSEATLMVDVSGEGNGAHQIYWDANLAALFVIGDNVITQVAFPEGPSIVGSHSFESGVELDNIRTFGFFIFLTNVDPINGHELIVMDLNEEPVNGAGVDIARLHVDNIDDIAPLQGDGEPGPGPRPAVVPIKIDFGFVPLDNDVSQALHIANLGFAEDQTPGTLAVNSVTLAPQPTDPYYLGEVRMISPDGVPATLGNFPDVQFPVNLDPDWSLDIDVHFAPDQDDVENGPDFNDHSITVNTDAGQFVTNLCGTIEPPVTLHFEPIYVRPGSQGIMEVELSNDAPVAGIQFRIQPLDDQDHDGIADVISPFVWLTGIINDLENQGFTVTHATDENMVTTVLLFNAGGGWIEPGHWRIMELIFDIHDPPGLPWWIFLDTFDVVVSDPESNPLPWSLWPGSIHIAEPGDVAGGPLGEGDGSVDILDIVKEVKYILGILPPPNDPALFFQANPVADQMINVQDLVWMINEFLFQQEFLDKAIPPSQPVVVSLGDLQSADGGGLLMPITLTSDGAVAAMQATLTFDPALVQVGQAQLAGRAAGFSVQQQVVDGELRLVVFSASGEALPSGSGAMVLVPVSLLDGSGAVPALSLSDVLLADRSAGLVEAQIGVGSVSLTGAPSSWSVSSAWPNPFNPSTTISYEVPRSAHVSLVVYNLLGQEVVRLVDSAHQAGRYEVVWHGRNGRGQAVASGVYLYRIATDDGYSAAKRMTLLK